MVGCGKDATIYQKISYDSLTDVNLAFPLSTFDEVKTAADKGT